MQYLFTLACLSVLSQAVDIDADLAALPIDIDFAYSEHLTRFGLVYNSVDEYETRKAIFAQTDSFIREHNTAVSSYKLGHNHFSDRTP